MKKISTVILVFLGIGFFAIGGYLSYEASKGEAQVAEAQQNGQRRPILGPVRKEMSSQAAQNKQKRIGQEEVKISSLQVTAHWLQGTGVLLFILGAGSLAFSCCCCHCRRKK